MGPACPSCPSREQALMRFVYRCCFRIYPPKRCQEAFFGAASAGLGMEHTISPAFHYDSDEVSVVIVWSEMHHILFCTSHPIFG